jgi:hypothetical protein
LQSEQQKRENSGENRRRFQMHDDFHRIPVLSASLTASATSFKINDFPGIILAGFRGKVAHFFFQMSLMALMTKESAGWQKCVSEA